jgi:hypothetical protein
MVAISGADRNRDRDCDCKVRMLRQRGQKSDCGDRALEDIMADYYSSTIMMHDGPLALHEQDKGTLHLTTATI